MKTNLSKKIDDLFHCRGIDSCARNLLTAEGYLDWRHKATRVQIAVYQLDDYYENNDQIVALEQIHLWNNLLKTCRESTGVEHQASADHFVRELKRYASFEQMLHEFKPIDQGDLSEVLHLKCADVRFARSLIFFSKKAKYIPSVELRSSFDILDQLMELVEDYDDAPEDSDDWNLNFWITPARQGLQLENTISNCLEMLATLAEKCAEEFKALPKSEIMQFGLFYLSCFERVNQLQRNAVSLYENLVKYTNTPYLELPILPKKSSTPLGDANTCRSM